MMDNEKYISTFLDWIGFSQEEIRWRRSVWNDLGTMLNIKQRIKGSLLMYCTGSRPEGTGVNVLGADIDIMYHTKHAQVIHDYKDWEHLTGVTTLLSDTTALHPGYCRLLLMYRDAPIVVKARGHPLVRTPTFVAHNGVIALPNNFMGLHDEAVPNGPARTSSFFGNIDVDNVNCLATVFPPGAREWVDRDRSNRFPSQEFVYESVKRDVFVVGTGYKNSEYPDLQWRFSFSLIELAIVLIWPINVTRCYVLLKIMKNHIASVSPHLSNTLSSYHLKTTLFWLTEETGLEFWENSSVGECLMFSLKRLLCWIERGFIPHYFMKDNNLFDLHTGTPRQRDVAAALRDMITEGPASILRCEYCRKLSVGMISTSVDGRSSHVQSERRFFHCVFAFHIFGEPTLELSSNTRRHLTSLCDALGIIQEAIPRYEGGVTKGLGYMGAYLRCTLATSVLSISLQNRLSNVTRHLVFKISEQLLKSSVHELVGQLKLANLYYLARKCELATKFLQVLSEMDSFRVARWDVFRKRWFHKRCHMSVLVNAESPAEVFSSLTSTSLLFQLPEIHAIPYALKFEMFKAQLGFGGEDSVSEYTDMCSVDPLVFVYYLQYLCYENIGEKKHAEVAFDNLQWVAKQKDRIQRDTTWNILGHCYYKQGKLDQAVNCLVESLRIQPSHSVALLHLVLVIKGAFAQRKMLPVCQ